VSEVAVTAGAPRLTRARRGTGVALIAAVARRNLGRNWRRTGLTAGGIGFAVALLSFAISSQIGSYGAMIDNATALLSSHVQVQHPGYFEDPRIEYTVRSSRALADRIRQQPGVRAVTERVMAFTLVSAGERSFAGQLVGVDPEREPLVSTIPNSAVAGRFLGSTGSAIDGAVEAYVGAGLARNLGIGLGDEAVLLGMDETGGVAALVTRVVGIFTTGQADMDRALVEAPIAAVRDAFALGDQAHAIVVRGNDVSAAPSLAAELRKLVGENEAVLEWQQLMPELEQAIELDRTSGRFLYGLIGIIVTFSVVNTFIMLVFERTREFGMLLAVGMRPWAIIGMLQLEAVWLALLGIAFGLAVSLPAIAWVAVVGIPFGEESSALMAAFHMPDRFYTAFGFEAIVPPCLAMIAATMFAAIVGSLRVLRVQPAQALRAT
jgi:ABC-type lipoprotein release transport system permease subunit